MDSPPGVPTRLRGRLHERARLELRLDHDADPLGAACAFLAEHGLRLDPAAPSAARAAGRGGPVGAALLVGGAIGAGDALRATTGAAPSPCPAVPDVCVVVYGVAPHVRRHTPGTATVGPWKTSWSDLEHAAAVETVREQIARGELYQANVVGHRSAEISGDPWAVASALAQVPGARHAGALAGEGWLVATASPELLLSVQGRTVRTRPIKGTAARGSNPPEDLLARKGLRRSEKDRAEHMMIVDLERNDLARVAETGSVRVPELYAVRPLAGVWHAESTVEATLRPDVDLHELLAALLPGGSVTGAPKLAALQSVAALEPVGRGPAMGALGWLDARGRLELSLTIRTMAVADGRVHLWAGGGITWGSDAVAEVAEAHAKAAPLLRSLSALSADRHAAPSTA